MREFEDFIIEISKIKAPLLFCELTENPYGNKIVFTTDEENEHIVLQYEREQENLEDIIDAIEIINHSGSMNIILGEYLWLEIEQNLEEDY